MAAQKGLLGQVGKLDFLLRKGFVVSSISLACIENGLQGSGVATRGRESRWGLSWDSGKGDREGREDGGMGQDLIRP